VQSGEDLSTVIGEQRNVAADAFEIHHPFSCQFCKASVRPVLIKLPYRSLHGFQGILVHSDSLA
jgi:hypothetical protein